MFFVIFFKILHKNRTFSVQFWHLGRTRMRTRYAENELLATWTGCNVDKFLPGGVSSPRRAEPKKNFQKRRRETREVPKGHPAAGKGSGATASERSERSLPKDARVTERTHDLASVPVL